MGYRCYVHSINDHYDSIRSDCEAPSVAINEGILGYIWKEANAFANAVLYRCYFANSWGHMTSSSPTCEGWRQVEAIIGYASRRMSLSVLEDNNSVVSEWHHQLACAGPFAPPWLSSSSGVQYRTYM